MAVLAALLTGGSGTAWATSGEFVAEATEASWDGVAVTLSFREVNVVVNSDVTTISVKATVVVDAVCTLGTSIIDIRGSATALRVADYPISDDGTVAGAVRMLLKVEGTEVPGYSCVTRHFSVTVVLEDFWTGATLVHRIGTGTAPA